MMTIAHGKIEIEVNTLRSKGGSKDTCAVHGAEYFTSS
jgi:hypothetical protein